jgi:hypothetical protein
MLFSRLRILHSGRLVGQKDLLDALVTGGNSFKTDWITLGSYGDESAEPDVLRRLFHHDNVSTGVGLLRNNQRQTAAIQ